MMQADLHSGIPFHVIGNQFRQKAIGRAKDGTDPKTPALVIACRFQTVFKMAKPLQD